VLGSILVSLNTDQLTMVMPTAIAEFLRYRLVGH
jgi:hypothetical protein